MPERGERDIMKLNGFLAGLVCLATSLTVWGQDVTYDAGGTTVETGIFDVGTNSVWVGNTNSNNRLEMADDSTLSANQFTLGAQASSTNNSVLLGEDVALNLDGSLVVGLGGAYNHLELKDGASINADKTIDEQYLVIGVADTSVSNRVEIAGGDVYFNDVVIGSGGSSNVLMLSDGGFLDAVDGYVGFGDSSTGNQFYVSDGAIADFRGTLYVGSFINADNRVVVTNGGFVGVDELILDGTNNWFDLDAGGTLTVASDFSASTNGFNWNKGGTLNVGGTLTGVNGGIESNRTLGVFGTWDQSGSNVVVGGVSSSNTLHIFSSGQVLVDSLTIGASNTAMNAVLVESNGKLSIADGLAINAGNSLTIQNGGWLSVSTNFDASITGFNFAAGGTLETTGTLTGMTSVLDGARSVRLVGGNWNAGNLVVGQGAANSSVYLSSSGILTSGDVVLGAEAGANNNRIMIDNGTWNSSGSITVGSNGNYNTVSLIGGAEVLGATDLTIGIAGSSNTVRIAGTNSHLDANGDVTFGGAGSGNRLFVESGGRLDSASGTIGGSGSEVWISGTDSIWVTIGNIEINGTGNALNITNSGAVNVGQELSVRNGANLKFESGGTAVSDSYYQEDDTRLLFDSVTNAPLVKTSGGSGATIEAGASFEFTGQINELTRNVTNEQLLVESVALTVNGNANPTTNDLSTLNGISSDDSNLYSISFRAQNDDLIMGIFRESLAVSAGFESNTQMSAVSDAIDDIADQDNQKAINQLEVLGQLSRGANGQQNAQLTQLYERNAPTYMHMEGLFEGMRQVQNRGIMPDTYWAIGPRGPQGPHLYGEQSQLWFKGYGSWGTQDADGAYSGYDQSVYGLVIGWDKAFGDLLFGLAGGYSSSNIKQDDSDKSDSGLGYGILYGSWGTMDWFADGSLALGFGSVENKTGTAFDTKSDADMTQLGFYLGGGKEMVFRDDKIFLTPTVAILGGNYSQDGYTEKSSNSVSKKVDDYSRFSFKTDIGAEMVFRKELEKSVLMPDVHAKWLHEFNTDADSVGYTLVGGTGDYSYTMTAPVSDLFEVGVGLSLWTENAKGSVYEFALGYDARFGSGYLANVLDLRVNVEF